MEDLNFLRKCLTNKLTPKFVRLKISAVHHQKELNKFQHDMIQREIQTKQRLKENHAQERELCYKELSNILSWLDYNHAISIIERTNCRKQKGHYETHTKKVIQLRSYKMFFISRYR